MPEGGDRLQRVPEADPALVAGEGDLGLVYPKRAARLQEPIEVRGGVRLRQGDFADSVDG